MAEMMTKCKEANVNASPAKVFLDYWIPNCSSIYIRLVKLYKWKKVRRLLPRVKVRRKSTHLVRWNWQLLFGMAVKEHQKNFAFPREMKKKIQVVTKIFIEFSDIDPACYMKLNSQFLFHLIKKLSCPQTSSVPVKAVGGDDSKHLQSVTTSTLPQSLSCLLAIIILFQKPPLYFQPTGFSKQA